MENSEAIQKLLKIHLNAHMILQTFKEYAAVLLLTHNSCCDNNALNNNNPSRISNYRPVGFINESFRYFITV